VAAFSDRNTALAVYGLNDSTLEAGVAIGLVLRRGDLIAEGGHLGPGTGV